MKNTKYIFPAFTFYDRTGIQDFLEKKALDGWMLDRLGGFSWKFRRIEPRRIHFAVTYFPKASAFDPKPSEQQEMFQEFCAHSGWNLVAASAQIQIFCNEEENPVPIETDPEIELENIRRTAKKTYLPTFYILLPVGILPWLTLSMSWKNDPVQFLSNNIYFFNMLTSVVTLLLCFTELFGYYRWRAKAVAAAKEGQFLPTRGSRKLQIVLICLLLISLAAFIFDGANPRAGVMMAMLLLLIGGVVALSLGAIKLMKRMNFSARKNMVISHAVMIVLTLVALGLGTSGVMGLVDASDSGNQTLPTYEFLGRQRTLYRDDIPLKIQDIMDADPEIYSYRIEKSGESLLLKYTDVYQRPRLDMLDQSDLEYTIVEVKADFLYDFCLREMIGQIEDRGYNWCDPEPWGADEVYGAFRDVGYYDMYILCYGNRIIALEANWELTEEQMAIVGSIFG